MNPHPLRVLFDARMASWGGVGRYTTGLLGGLARVADPRELTLVALRLPEDRDRFPASLRTGVRWVGCARNPWFPAGIAELTRAARSCKAHLIHLPHISPFPPAFRGRRIGTLHDLKPLHHHVSMPSPIRRTAYKTLVRLFVAQADCLIFGSRAAAVEALKADLRVNRFAVIPHGTDTRFAPQPDREQRDACRQAGVPLLSIMATGPFRPHKNLEVLVQAYALLPKEMRSRVPLVMLGNCSSPYGRQLRSLARRLLPSSGPGVVFFPGFVSEEALPSVLASARVFVFPSLAEGFGLPALEAWRCGVPVIASSTTPVGEFLGPCASYFDPGSPRELAGLLQQHLEVDQVGEFSRGGNDKRTGATANRARERSWDDVARDTIQLYRACHRPSVDDD
ncbi:MAG: glycosyltransferase family 4 protein [Actinobacteria bacterium]|nr:glycosyltransferase family 4 protein [Actinomycetota bacterium]